MTEKPRRNPQLEGTLSEQLTVPVVVVRHPKERLAKCSLEPLRSLWPFLFIRAKPGFSLSADGFILLDVEAEQVLSESDRHLTSEERVNLSQSLQQAGFPAGTWSAADQSWTRPLLLLDATWRLLPSLLQGIQGKPLTRKLPPCQTAYPRVSKISADPMGGLASVEALYLACRLLGRDDPSLLDHYHWREPFLRQFT